MSQRWARWALVAFGMLGVAGIVLGTTVAPPDNLGSISTDQVVVIADAVNDCVFFRATSVAPGHGICRKIESTAVVNGYVEVTGSPTDFAADAFVFDTDVLQRASPAFHGGDGAALTAWSDNAILIASLMEGNGSTDPFVSHIRLKLPGVLSPQASTVRQHYQIDISPDEDGGGVETKGQPWRIGETRLASTALNLQQATIDVTGRPIFEWVTNTSGNIQTSAINITRACETDPVGPDTCDWATTDTPIHITLDAASYTAADVGDLILYTDTAPTPDQNHSYIILQKEASNVVRVNPPWESGNITSSTAATLSTSAILKIKANRLRIEGDLVVSGTAAGAWTGMGGFRTQPFTAIRVWGDSNDLRGLAGGFVSHPNDIGIATLPDDDDTNGGHNLGGGIEAIALSPHNVELACDDEVWNSDAFMHCGMGSAYMLGVNGTVEGEDVTPSLNGAYMYRLFTVLPVRLNIVYPWGEDVRQILGAPQGVGVLEFEGKYHENDFDTHCSENVPYLFDFGPSVSGFIAQGGVGGERGHLSIKMPHVFAFDSDTDALCTGLGVPYALCLAAGTGTDTGTCVHGGPRPQRFLRVRDVNSVVNLDVHLREFDSDGTNFISVTSNTQWYGTIFCNRPEGGFTSPQSCIPGAGEMRGLTVITNTGATNHVASFNENGG